jgi:hypothetical protein
MAVRKLYTQEGPYPLARPFLAVRCDEQQEHTKGTTYGADGETMDQERAVELAIYHRVFDCERYGECLDYAAGRQWQSFTCRRCALAIGRL